MPLLYVIGLVFGVPISILYLIAFIFDRRANKAGNYYDFDKKPNDPYAQAEVENAKNMAEMNSHIW